METGSSRRSDDLSDNCETAISRPRPGVPETNPARAWKDAAKAIVDPADIDAIAPGLSSSGRTGPADARAIHRSISHCDSLSRIARRVRAKRAAPARQKQLQQKPFRRKGSGSTAETRSD